MDGLGTTRTPAPSASTSVLPALSVATWDPNAPAPRSPQQEGDGWGAPSPRRDPCAELGPAPPEAEADARAPTQAGKVCGKGSFWAPPAAGSGLRVPPSSPWSPRHRPPQGAPQAAQDVDGGGEDRSPARPQIPRVSCPSCPPAVRTRRARRSPASSWIGSWEPRRPLLSPGAEEAERRAERRFCFAFLKLRLPSSLPGRAALPFPGRPGPRPGSTARRAQRPAPRSGPRGGSAGAARTLRG